MNQKKFNSLTPAQQGRYLMNEEKEVFKGKIPAVDFNNVVVDPPKKPKRKFVLFYSFRKGKNQFLTEQDDFPAAYKAFWAMVEEKQLWKKSKNPVGLIDCYEQFEYGRFEPIQITNFTNEQLGIKKI